ncbi:MAG: TlpA family protein disulfide reductase [Gammaproteobacteria bacterium]|nr:TlpA family protein disulfide reductase [Gammaproteobacteria bacterium]
MARRFQAVALLLLLAGGPVAATAGTVAGAAAASPIPLGGRLPDVELAGLNGPARRLSAFRGEGLIINVWASWCGPCRAEMGSLEQLAWAGLPPRVRIIGISTDDDPAAARRFLGDANATISQFIDHGRVVERMLGASTIPLTVLVGPDGRLLAKFYGARDWSAPASRRLIAAHFGARGGSRSLR